MKKILGLDLGTTSIGWALVNEAENENEKSSIIKLGVRVNPLTVDELTNFEKGKSITTNAERTLKRSMRRNLQRYKLRRENLIEILKEKGFISENTLLSENGNRSTFETYHLRAKAVTQEISLEQLARVLLMINKKRGYKSSRKAKSQDEGQLIDGMEIAKKLYNEDITPGQLCLQRLKAGKRSLPDFYRSDLQTEFDKVFNKQSEYYPEYLSVELKEELRGKKRDAVWAICSKKFKTRGYELVGIKRQGNTFDQKVENYEWRVKALYEKLDLEQFVIVIQQINIQFNNSSGYLGAISDRSKELFFNKQTVGQYLMVQLEQNPHTSLKNQVFYRQDYLDEFNAIWENQRKYHTELTEDLKAEIRDVIIFYQRRLKSQKGLISFCEFESRKIEVEIDGKKKIKTVGAKVCPKSSPFYQEFRIWQNLNNIQVFSKKSNAKRFLEQEEKAALYAELSVKNKMSKLEALKFLFINSKDLDLNFKDIEGNRTQWTLFDTYRKIIELSGHGEYDFTKMKAPEIKQLVGDIFKGLNYNTEILEFNSLVIGNEYEKQGLFKLWHLLYSFEGDDSKTGNEKLIDKITQLYGFEKEYASMLANIAFEPDYGSISTKAIRKILPYLADGNEYSLACEYAGYKHSKKSLTSEELDRKEYKDQLNILPRNSLRNPVVEKILNQLINVVNAITKTCQKPDEIRIELARELKKSAKEREEISLIVTKNTAEHEKYRSILQTEFGFTHVSRTDIIRYKLYLELAPVGYKTLYSQTYIPKEKIFSKEFDIEHIIPQSRLFDDSFSNKTLELRSINIEKGNDTARDFVLAKYGEQGLAEYLKRIEELYKSDPTKTAKLRKLKMKGDEIPNNFINRDLRDTQYIARKAKEMLEEMVRTVVSTTGSITDRLREDWQLIDVMQELNWEKYDKLGLTEIIENRDGHKIRRIKDWTKRNDHRHHAMDALTIAFTKPSYIQYLNNLNARSDRAGSIYGIETKELYRDDKGKLKFKPPISLDEFRAEAKRHLENILISIKAKNKVTTININSTSKKHGINKKRQLTPRGQLHLETIYGSFQQHTTKEEKVGANFNQETIARVTKPNYREALLNRLIEFNNDPKKAFTGNNSLEKNPIFLDSQHLISIPIKVKTQSSEIVYTIRKEINPDLKLDKIVDSKIRSILEDRLKEYNGDTKKAFSNLNDNPIWLNKEKGISIKRVTISGISNAIALHDKKDKEGILLQNNDGKPQPVDFVNTGNNHHVAIYQDNSGNLQENTVSFFEATTKINQGLSVIDKNYKENEGWKFLFSMKQNEFFVFPNSNTGFNPADIDLLNPNNYNIISPNLYRVQKIASKDYFFRHHLETTVENNNQLKGITWLRLGLSGIKDIVKVRINHLGEIVHVGEY